MKKLIVAIIAIAVIVPLCVFLAFSSANSGVEGSSVPTDILAGDVNGDGKISVIDSISLMLYLAGKPVEIVNDAADVNGDGVVDKKDCSRIIGNAVNNIQESANTDKCEHSLIKEIEVVPATCTESGTAEGWKCTKCNKLFKDQTANIIVTAAKLTIPASHTEGEWIIDKEPTATEDGVKHQICSACGTTLKTEAIQWTGATHSRALKFELNSDGTAYAVTGFEPCYNELWDGPCDNTCINSKTMIPSEYQGLPVTVICDNAFHHSRISEIIIPNSITYIGMAAFRGCGLLQNVIIPDSVTFIGDYAFAECPDLEQVEILANVESLPWCMFSKCYELTTLTISGSVENIGGYAFEGTKIKSLFLPKSIKCVETSSLYSSFNLEYLESIVVEKDNPVYHSNGNCLIETESKTLVMGCNNSTIPIDGSVEIIGENAFGGCKELTMIEIPNSVTTIYSDAFRFCESLLEISFGSNLETLHKGIFTGCNNLALLTVNDNNKKYHSAGNCLIETASGALIYGSNSSIIPSDGSIRSIASEAFSHCKDVSALKIPSSVEKISSTAFAWNHGYEQNGLVYLDNWIIAIYGGIDIDLVIKSNVVGIAEGLSYWNVKTITVENGNQKYHSINNCLIESKTKTLVLTCKNSILPDDGSISTIGYEAINASCFSSTNVIIPKSVTHIMDQAFTSNYGYDFESVELPAGIRYVGYGLDSDTIIIYNGTISEWHSNVENQLSPWTVIKCSDGDTYAWFNINIQ